MSMWLIKETRVVTYASVVEKEDWEKFSKTYQ